MSDRQSITPIGSFTSASALLATRGTDEDWENSFKVDPTLNKYKESEAMGYGIERCLYEFNPELSCLSPCLIHAAVLTPAEALIALEEVATQPNHPTLPVDRHLAAFLISRWKGLSLSDLRDMGKPQREVKNLAILRILAGVQGGFKIKALPNLCQWMADVCSPMITQYHNLKARAKAQGDIAKAVSSGQLSKLVKIFENRQALREDDCDFQAAKIEVLLIESEIKEIEAKVRNRNNAQHKSGLTIWATLTLPLRELRNAWEKRQANHRMRRLYERSEMLYDAWGDALLPGARNPSLAFWKRLWAKMNEADIPKMGREINVDGRLKSD
ncbi:MAG: hypothetical protein K2Y18_01020 [Alphaproteobacteria bacterium]|jgi:hypothetical protein|nr:hypothetical protein [Alphaproteobacteria bacterium]